jgi:predicted ATPase
MKIFIAYELGGVETNYLSKEIEIQDDEYPNGISREYILNLLEKFRYQLKKDAVISYYNELHESYVILKPGNMIPETLRHPDMSPQTNRLQILIRRSSPQTVQGLQEKIEGFEKKIKDLESKLSLSENKTYSKSKSRLNIYPSYTELDIAMLHAAPLAINLDDNIIPIKESSLDFEAERRSLVKYLELKDIGADIRFEAGTAENLAEILEYKAKIIYFSGQSYMKTAPDLEFVLAFEQSNEITENKVEIGLLDEMTTQKLKKIFTNAPQYFQVVIVKGWYSREMANIFINAGFNCVVAVQDHKSDTKSHKFIAEFCKNLLNGNTISMAFKKAEISSDDDSNDIKNNMVFKKTEISSSEDTNDIHCCCAHTHKPNCLWKKKLNMSNTAKRHSEHVPTCRCRLKGNEHKTLCSWSGDFNSKYCHGREITTEEFYAERWRICCCSPELDHIKLKYSILYNDESVLDQVLFTQKKNTIEYKSPLPVHLKPPFKDKPTVGRRTEIRNVILLVLMNKCVNAVGPVGVGKTMLIKRAAQYAYDRRIFKDGVVYLDFSMKTDIIFLYRFISNTLNLPSFNHYKDLCSVLTDLDVLMILDNIDSLVKQDENAFIENYLYLIKNTLRPKFIIVSQSDLKLEKSEKYSVPLLNSKEAKEVMRHYNIDYKNNERLKSELINMPDSTPAEILKLVSLYSNEKVENRVIASPLLDPLQCIEKKIPRSLDLLKILFYLPSGAYNFNLDYICEKINLNYKDIIERLSPEFIHAESGFEFILLKSNVSTQLEAIKEPRKDYIILVLKHLGMFSRGILKSILDFRFNIGADIRNSLMFVNAGLEKDMWACVFSESFDISKKSIYDPSSIFNKIQANFWHYIKATKLEKLFDKNDKSNFEVFRALEEIMLCTAAIFILLDNYHDALEIIQRSKVCCNCFGLNECLGMLRLTEASIYSYTKQIDKFQECIAQVLEYYKISENSEGLAEALLLKAITTESTPEGLLEAYELFKSHNKQLGRARAGLALSEYYLVHGHEIDIIEILKHSIDTFKDFRLFFWEARASICLSDAYLKSEKLTLAREILISTLVLTKRKKDSLNTKEISSKITKINEFVRKTKKNSITLLKAFPLVEKNNKDSINRSGPACRFSSSFRQDLQHKLKSTKKEVCVRMDILSRKTLKESLEENSMILHLASESCSSTHLYLEKENGLADPISLPELKELIGGDLKQYGIELVVLSIPFSIWIAEFFKKTLGVQHVICFNLLDYPKDGDPLHVYLAFESSIHFFCIEFYANILSRMTVRNAFLKAKGSMEVFMSEKVKQFSSLEIRGRHFEKWWRKHHKNEPILIEEYSTSHDRVLFDDKYAPDECFIEMSNPRAPCNIPKDDKEYKTFVGRQVEMHNVLNSLTETKCVHIFGIEGIGKTEFVAQIGYFLYVRNKYPDGIYLLDLSNKSSLDDVYKLFKDVGLVYHSSDIDPRTFLYERKILLILDNCDALYTRALHTFNSLLNIFLHECKISVIITSSIHIQVSESIEIRRFALRHLSNLESYMFLCLCSPDFTSQLLKNEADKKNYNKAVEEILRESQGLPKNIRKWAVKLKKQNVRHILDLISLRIFEESINKVSESEISESVLPELSLKRSNTMRGNEIDFYPDLPKLTQGKSTYEGNLISQRTSHI